MTSHRICVQYSMLTETNVLREIVDYWLWALRDQNTLQKYVYWSVTDQGIVHIVGSIVAASVASRVPNSSHKREPICPYIQLFPFAPLIMLIGWPEAREEGCTLVPQIMQLSQSHLLNVIREVDRQGKRQLNVKNHWSSGLRLMTLLKESVRHVSAVKRERMLSRAKRQQNEVVKVPASRKVTRSCFAIIYCYNRPLCKVCSKIQLATPLSLPFTEIVDLGIDLDQQNNIGPTRCSPKWTNISLKYQNYT